MYLCVRMSLERHPTAPECHFPAEKNRKRELRTGLEREERKKRGGVGEEKYGLNKRHYELWRVHAHPNESPSN